MITAHDVNAKLKEYEDLRQAYLEQQLKDAETIDNHTVEEIESRGYFFHLSNYNRVTVVPATTDDVTRDGGRIELHGYNIKVVYYSGEAAIEQAVRNTIQ